MRRILLLLGVFVCAAAYVTWPFYTAWSIKEAVKNGNAALLARHVEWQPVKQSLKDSMSEIYIGPIEASLEDKPKRKGLWASVKEYYGRSMINSMVERYATPTGLPTLFSYGRTVNKTVLMKEDPDEGQPLYVRLSNSWSRIERAVFVTPTRFEIDLRDKFDADRIFAGVLELKDWRWKVTSLRVKTRQKPPGDNAPLGLVSAAGT